MAIAIALGLRLGLALGLGLGLVRALHCILHGSVDRWVGVEEHGDFDRDFCLGGRN